MPMRVLDSHAVEVPVAYYEEVPSNTTDDFLFFSRTIEARSEEHRLAMITSVERGWWSIAAGILRMELDSLIRVTYLRNHPRDRAEIISACVAGLGFGRFKEDQESVRRIPDRSMIDESVHGGWEKRVYDFGNRFIHLTEAQNYTERDPFRMLEYDEREEIVKYLDYYHGGKPGLSQLSVDSTYLDVANYAPYVLEKITSNLQYALEQLGRQIRH
jgi:hypothetical protein